MKDQHWLSAPTSLPIRIVLRRAMSLPRVEELATSHWHLLRVVKRYIGHLHGGNGSSNMNHVLVIARKDS